MNEIITKDDIKIENMIYEINGKQVMLDSDLAKLYNCKKWNKRNQSSSKNQHRKISQKIFMEINRGRK